MISFGMIQASSAWALLLVSIVVLVIQKSIKTRRSKHLLRPLVPSTKLQQACSQDPYHSIEPLTQFNVNTEEPLKLRTFKPKYHLTMALENATVSDLIAMDKTYKARIDLRSDLIRDNECEVLACRPTIYPAVTEFYVWMITEYLPKRFPTVYTTAPDGLYNSVTGRTLPLAPSDPKEALSLLGTNVDCDFLFLLPIPAGDKDYPEKDGTKYRLEGFVTCFPSGFRTSAKLGLSLADIHTPVPGYASKLQKSMDRFFASLPVGRIVKRHNWSVTTHPHLHALAGNHMSEEEHEEGMEEEIIDLSQTVLRCERQTLHRLPDTKALVFAFKTYTYPIKELRDEGSGNDLADAIEGLGKGNVPEITVYKRQVLWGEKVSAYLRGEIDE